MNTLTVGLVGDFDPDVPAHQGIPPSIDMAARDLGINASYAWIPTPEIKAVDRLHACDGIWCVPASPYRNMDGALLAIRWARKNHIPFLGTCGGFQHALVEYARNVLGWLDADHAESNPDATRAVISPLACALVETADTVHLFPNTLISRAYGASDISEGYRCGYGLNEEFRQALLAGPLRGSADDDSGEIRAVELDDHPFFVATLFQPERAALKGKLSPLVRAFVQACAKRRRSGE